MGALKSDFDNVLIQRPPPPDRRDVSFLKGVSRTGARNGTLPPQGGAFRRNPAMAVALGYDGVNDRKDKAMFR